MLELGPAKGYFSRQMAVERNCTIDAVELDAHMAEQARPFCRKLVLGDLSTLRLDEHFLAGSYQIIVVADVIEHIVNPRELLDQLKPLLASDGQMLLSVPNVAYAGLIVSLLAGKFEYREEGLLDRTHLRFFTRNSLGILLADAGFFTVEWVPVFRPLNESEFKIRVETLPSSLRDVLFSSPHALCYQWLVRASNGSGDQVHVEPRPCWQDAFPIRAYCSSIDDPANTATVCVAWGKVGVARQSIKFNLPPLKRSEINLVLSDRIGFLRLYGMKLCSADGLVWSWSHGDDLSALAVHFHRVAIVSGGDHALVTILEAESWLQLNTSEATIASDGTLEIELGWPMSSDYMTAKAGWEQLACSPQF